MGTAVVLVAVPLAVTVVVGVLGDLLFPGGGDEAVPGRRLVAVLILAAGAVAVVARARAWRRVAAGGPDTWRHVGLLAVPLMVALAPLVAGLDLPSAGVLTVLVAGYAATGVFEELWHRGVVLDTMRSLGVRKSVVIGGALFGVSHLGNVLFGQPVAVSLAQAFGAFCFGIGFGVFRWRTDAVWLLVGIHALGDLMLQITDLQGGSLWAFLVGHDTLMLLWGLYCLRGLDDDVTLRSSPTGPGHAAG